MWTRLARLKLICQHDTWGTLNVGVTASVAWEAMGRVTPL